MALGPVMVDLDGLDLTQEDRELLCHPQVGGVILFARNYESPQQLAQLTAAIHQLRTPRLLIAVDQEGGRVQRFRDGFTRLPPLARLGELYAKDIQRALRLAQTTGWLMAVELRAVGVDFSFAPVLDLGRDVSEVIGDRAFAKQADAVARLAQRYIKGMHEAGMAATGKHFPGHGAVAADSHVALPIDERSYADIEAEDLVPFRRMIEAGLAGIMPAHVVYRQVDERPAGFSAYWIQTILRQQLRFQGVVFSDDLSMEGAGSVGDYLQRAKRAFHAGCDMVLVCNQREGAQQIVNGLRGYDHLLGNVRLAHMHGIHAIDRAQLHQNPAWQQAVHAVEGYAATPFLDLDL